MDSLFDIQYEVESAIRKHLREDRRTLWDELVESSVRLGGFGCDGLLIGEVESFAESLLSSMNDEAMRRIWLDTENATMALEQGFEDAYRWEMVYDVMLDVSQYIAARVCKEAQGILKKRRRKRNP